MTEITENERSHLAKIEELSGLLMREQMDHAKTRGALDWANRKIRRLEAVIEEAREMA
jgi:hypothetical protein